MNNNNIFKKFILYFICLSMLFFACFNIVSAEDNLDLTEVWYGYAEGEKPTYKYPVSSTYSTPDRFDNGINIYKYKYKPIIKTTHSWSDAYTKMRCYTAGECDIRAWNTNGQTWHITDYDIDVDAYRYSDWGAYKQPKVTLRCNGYDIYTLQKRSDSEYVNGSGRNLDLACNGTITWHSYGFTGDGRDQQGMPNNSNWFKYYTIEISDETISDWAYAKSQLSNYASIGDIYSVAYSRPTLAVNTSSFRKNNAYTQTVMTGDYKDAETAILPLQLHVYYFSNGADAGSAVSSADNSSLPTISWTKEGYSMASSLYFDSSGISQAINTYSSSSFASTNIKNKLSTIFNKNNIYNNLSVKYNTGGYYLEGNSIQLYAKWLPCNFNIVMTVKDPNDSVTQEISDTITVSYNDTQSSTSFNFGSVQYDSNASSLNFTTIDTSSDDYIFVGWFDKEGNMVIDANGKLLASSSLVSNRKITPDSSIYDGTIAKQVNSETTGDTKTINLYGRWKLKDTTPPEITITGLDILINTCQTGQWFNWYNLRYESSSKYSIDIKVEDKDEDFENTFYTYSSGLNYVYILSSDKKTVIYTLLPFQGSYSKSNFIDFSSLDVNILSILTRKTTDGIFYVSAADVAGNTTIVGPYTIDCIDTQSPSVPISYRKNDWELSSSEINSNYIIDCGLNFSSSSSYQQIDLDNNKNSYHFSVSKDGNSYNLKMKFTDDPTTYEEKPILKSSGIDSSKSYILLQYYDSVNKKWIEQKKYIEEDVIIEWNITGVENLGYINIYMNLQDLAGNRFYAGNWIPLNSDGTPISYKNAKTWFENSTGFCKIQTNTELIDSSNALIDFSYIFNIYYYNLEENKTDFYNYLVNNYQNSDANETIKAAYEYITNTIKNDTSKKSETAKRDSAIIKFLNQYRYSYWQKVQGIK